MSAEFSRAEIPDLQIPVNSLNSTTERTDGNSGHHINTRVTIHIGPDIELLIY